MTENREPQQDSDKPLGIYNSGKISLAIPAIEEAGRPPTVKHVSAPAYQSPLRHHRRAASTTREVKTTLNARSQYSNSEDDGTAEHRINQYVIKQEIGRGSFGAVHLAVDQYGHEYAVKEFSKSRLRKRAQSNLLRRPDARRRNNQLAANFGFNSPLHRHSSSDKEPNNSLDLIKEEIAIMKKLNHPNVVALVEVLDDPEEDSLYMVLEMCKKGVVMKVGLGEKADPYDEESCRCWFRDMILGLEYLHEQGIIHRDIKPDNCLITKDDVLKFVDFGVSEMFEKVEDMKTAKSAGSPAFMPPELCVAKHGHVDGRAADIWSMGVCLFCLRYGHIPFERTSVIELYESIRHDKPDCGSDSNEDFIDLMYRLLEKDPAKRIKIPELRVHPWVTKRGKDPLLSKEENVSVIVGAPTDAELNDAITGNMSHLMVVMRAVKRFKGLLLRKRPELMEGIFGRASRIVQPPQSMRPDKFLRKSRSSDADDRRRVETALTTEGVHREIPVSDDLMRLPKELDNVAITQDDKSNKEVIPAIDHPHPSVKERKNKPPLTAREAANDHRVAKGKGQAHNPLEDTLFLDLISSPGSDSTAGSFHVVSESPGAVEGNVYEMAYQEEVQRILAAKGRSATLYLTRRVENNETI
ncbi:kinase-like protein [Patellaria atrata CBS 101060]|uniref:Kinase-like protein n=1 Tax=Patellaria atrata CBS 101060 TaxID=1346257 RepID=A0A9P4SGY6_9PEZI|nr:kinase-like protein [Patellaria atrata CBS 101060]